MINWYTLILLIAGFLLAGCCKEDFIVPDEAITDFYVFVSNADSDDVSVIDPLTNTEVDRLSCATSCNEPRNLAVSPNKQMIYVPYRQSDLVSIIDPKTLAVVGDVTDASLDEPYAIAFTADNSEAWVVNKKGGGSTTGSITIINTTSRLVTATLNHVSISSPEGITIANGKAYVINRGDGDIPVFNVANRSFITSIVAPGSESRFGAALPNGNFVYVANGTNILKIETTNNTIQTTISIPGFSRNLCVSPNGGKVFVADQSSEVYSIDVTTNNVTSIVFSGASSIYAVAVSSAVNVAFVTDENTDNVYLFNPLTGQVINDGFGDPIQISVGVTPRAIVAQ